MKDATISELYDLTQTIAAKIFEGKTYPWEVLPLIKDFILELGETLDPAEYEKRGENVWIAKDAVIADNFHGMYLMTEYLYEHGLTKLAFVGSIHFSSSIMDRYCGFSKAVLEHRDVTPAEWILEDRDERGQIEIHLPEQMPEAFVCNCDLTAGLLMLELKNAASPCRRTFPLSASTITCIRVSRISRSLRMRSIRRRW